MKLELVYLRGQSCDWAEAAAQEYAQKISYFFKFERTMLKSKSGDRDQADEKRRAEANALLGHFARTDYVVLFDEKGKTFSSSMEFSAALIKCLGSSSPKVSFVIGGPYGFDSSVRERANAVWSLSDLTMNHHVAQVAALEQIYRALTIWKGLPYHNV
jgi:23S rRNA (pseudouridine1915-N3)-methyltransferase